MSVVGIDFGNESVVIAQAQRGGIDIILNESSNRKNPCMVSFQGKQRFMGEGALSIARTNYKNTVREMKRLIGRKWKDPELQADIVRLPFKVKENAKNGGVLIEVMYNDEPTALLPEQVMAMMLTKATAIAKAGNQDIPVADAVLSIPGWYTDSMRRSILDACKIAGLNTLRLMHETTATALAFGIYKSAKGLFSNEPQHVLFLDLGHASFSASVASFTQEALVVKSAAYDRNLGGRDFDWAIAQHLAESFKAKYKQDPRESPKSMLKLLDAAEKAKKNLSPIGVKDCVVNIECLMDEIDFNTRLSLEELEKLMEPLLSRLADPVHKALKEAQLTPDKLSAVEVVGGGTRVPAVKRKLAELVNADISALNFGLSCTLNADESVARGCALQCAILSSRFRVKNFGIVDIVPYDIRVSWEGAAGGGGAGGDAEDGDVSGDQNALVLFKKRDETPKTKRITFRRLEAFAVAAAYDENDEDLPPGAGRAIGEFKVLLGAGYVPGKDKEAPRVRVNVRHDINGILSVPSAQVMEEIADGAGDDAAAAAAAAEGDAKTGEAKMDVDTEAQTAESAPSDTATDANGASADANNTAAAANDSAAAAAAAAAAKKKFRKVNAEVESSTAAMTQAELAAAQEAETKMAGQDRILRETADKRNELESYIYSTRDKLAGALRPFIADADAAKFNASLTSAEDWLYSDEGFDTTKDVYAGKLAALHKQGDPVEKRMYEAEHRDKATQDLTAAVEVFKRFANSHDEAYAHIDEADRSKVREAASSAENWLFDMLGKQGALNQTQDPVLLVGDVRARTQNVSDICRPIMNKPKPAPAPAPAPAAAAAPTPAPADEKQTAEQKEASAEQPPAAADNGAAPMETDETEPKGQDGPSAMETDEK